MNRCGAGRPKAEKKPKKERPHIRAGCHPKTIKNILEIQGISGKKTHKPMRSRTTKSGKKTQKKEAIYQSWLPPQNH
jgi:hypothetical protein